MHPVSLNCFSSPIQRVTTWNDLFLKTELVQAALKLGYQFPSPIQIMGIPKIMQGHHLICQSKAGSGKTAVFAMGILHNLRPEVDGSFLPHQCIVIAKTRELAYQIAGDFNKLSSMMNFPKVRIGCFFGGTQVIKDIDQLTNSAKSPHIIVGTPGRLADLIEKGLINTRVVKYFVIDECDILLKDSLFEVDYIRRHFPLETQYIMVSATMPSQTKQKIREMCEGQIVEACSSEVSLDWSQLTHFYDIVQEENKFQLLEHILDRTPFNQAIIFTNTVKKTIQLANNLTSALFNPLTIHSDLTQQQRIKTYETFKSHGSTLLVATDLFGRGIDIQKVNLVINFDCPLKTEDYLHRVGRASRFGTSGVVVTFVDENKLIRESDRLEECGKRVNTIIGRLPSSLKPYI